MPPKEPQRVPMRLRIAVKMASFPMIVYTSLQPMFDKVNCVFLFPEENKKLPRNLSIPGETVRTIISG